MEKTDNSIAMKHACTLIGLWDNGIKIGQINETLYMKTPMGFNKIQLLVDGSVCLFLNCLKMHDELFKQGNCRGEVEF